MNVPGTALPGMTAYGVRGKTGRDIPEGQYTRTIYTLIKERSYDEVVRLLEAELQKNPDSRAALSLSAYAYYNMEDYTQAAEFYEQLSRNHPDIERYKLYYTQSLYKAGKFSDAYKASQSVEAPEHAAAVQKLQAAIKFGEGDILTTRALVSSGSADDADTLINNACLLFAENKFDEAARGFVSGMNMAGYTPEIAYYIALCYYRLKRYDEAMEKVDEIIERGIKDHPELSVLSVGQGLDVRSVGNSTMLHDTGLVQAFNLKAAIQYMRKELEAAKYSLKCMPPRKQEEWDAITLHNVALMNMDEDARGGFAKFDHLLANEPRPPETFANILLLFCQYQYYDLAAAALEQHPELTFPPHLSPELFQYIDATILQQTAPVAAFQQFDDLANKHVENLRRLIKNLGEALNRESDALTAALLEYNDALEAYLPVLMAQARIYWDRQNYAQAEKVLFQSVEFFYFDLEENPRIKKILSNMGDTAFESEVWKLNLAHVFFMQNNKFKEAISYYEPIVAMHEEGRLLDNVAAIVLANLCVSYIMITANEKAERLMHRIESEEEVRSVHAAKGQYYHSCIVNLVIGTLYCAKTHYDFGISRVFKSFVPIVEKLNNQTWFYAKRCILAVLEQAARHQAVLADATFHDMVAFLDECATHGKDIKTVEVSGDEHPIDATKNSVTWEARQIKQFVLRLRDM